MKILLCNERFLFRFGADRALTLLGKHLRQQGHTVAIMANRYDRGVVEKIFSEVINVPTGADDYLNLDEFTTAWLERTWVRHLSEAVPPDIVVVGGWPFFSAMEFFRGVGAKVVFVDFGAVPLEGYSAGALVIQQRLRSLRRRYLKNASLIVAISDFIARSQSRVDSDGEIPVMSVLLGADHIEHPTWSGELVQSRPHRTPAASLVTALRRQGRPTILALGRWEPGCYKNSEAALEVVDRLRGSFPDCALLVLDEPSNVRLSASLREAVLPIGCPDDEDLVQVMRQVDLGISVSRWEGFNLPLAEMQWLRRPVLAFDVAAHPEVVAHRWYLCQDTVEMAQKASEVLRGAGLDEETRRESLERFRGYFRWKRVAKTYEEVFAQVTGGELGIAANMPRPLAVIVDVTNATRDPANSGVIRVTRRICRELQRHHTPLFVVWDDQHQAYVLPTDEEYRQLGQFNGPSLGESPPASSDRRRTMLTEVPGWRGEPFTWLLLTETLPESRASQSRRFARSHGIGLAAIFYDAIPVLHPELCSEDVVANHSQYMRGLAECDVVMPISRFSARCLEEFWDREGLRGAPVRPIQLPGEFGRVPRSRQAPDWSANGVNLLCVSTLEPRKNHRALVRACLRLQERFPKLNWSLTLVGNRYTGAFDIADAIQAVAAANPRIRWLGIVDDDKLHQLYREASFTVYPSLVEGFGMPILESLWHARPCICSAEGALGELAEAGGCLVTDVRDDEQLSEAIHRLATDRNLFSELARQAIMRTIKTWAQYVDELLSILRATRVAGPEPDQRDYPATHRAGVPDVADWQEVLYPGCLREHWQMHDSERLAVTALLARHRPRCSIEVGTFEGGSLSLLAQYSEMVFSIDIDPGIPAKLPPFRNVSFLTGPSSVVLPLLLKELDLAEIPVEFVLIDADHSAMGVKGDIERVLTYIPRRPLFVMVHDSFNPECRRGMLEANWRRSPHLQWVDIDFVPGRIVEHEGTFRGELWGGLVLAFLTPQVRVGAPTIHCSATEMFSVMHEYTRRCR